MVGMYFKVFVLGYTGSGFDKLLTYYFTNARAFFTRCSRDSQSFFWRISEVSKREPIPTASAPAPNHVFRLSAVGSTPPVTRTVVHGIGAFKAFTKEGPRVSPGNNFTISTPQDSAVEISVNVAQPGK
jgi:hypothetical protein